ncbi:MAG: zinc ribbon domain-containing protein [Acidobacteria bacterium]|nr:MAG: zinc ribbon domain-containing protein [Acidobacteriota bacterium]
MPLYEYRCLGCGHQFELLILKTPQPIACPSCASDSVERVLSSFAVSSDGTRQASTAKAYAHNNKLNARQEPDKTRVQIEHKHQH